MDRGFLGTLPQWLMFGVLSVIGLYVRWNLGAGKLKIDAKSVEVTADQVAANAEDALRNHYSGELKSLREQVMNMGRHHLDRETQIDDRWRKLLTESEERHDECVRQREELSKKVRIVEERQLAQVKQFLAYQRSIVNVLPDAMKTPQMMAALESMELGATYDGE